MTLLKNTERKRMLHSFCLMVFWGIQWIERCSFTLLKMGLSAYSTDSNVDLVQEHSHRHNQIMFTRYVSLH